MTRRSVSSVTVGTAAKSALLRINVVFKRKPLPLGRVKTAHLRASSHPRRRHDGCQLALSTLSTGSAYRAVLWDTGTISVVVIGDRKRESDESFFVTLTGAQGAVIVDNRGVDMIRNDDR